MKKSAEKKKDGRRGSKKETGEPCAEEKKEQPSLVREGDVWRMRGVLLHRRCALLTYDCSFPAPEGEGGCKKIADFYRRLGEASYAYLTQQLFPATVTAYESCVDSRARYSFPRVRYLAECSVTQNGDGFFSARRCVRLLHGGRESARQETGEVFLLARGLLCPVGLLRTNGCVFAKEEAVSQHTGTHLFPFLRFFRHVPSGGFYLLENEIHLLPAQKRPSR